MFEFLQLAVQEKFGGNYDGPSPDYRASVYYRLDGKELEIRGYGKNPAEAAKDAWERYLEEVETLKLERKT